MYRRHQNFHAFTLWIHLGTVKHPMILCLFNYTTGTEFETTESVKRAIYTRKYKKFNFPLQIKIQFKG